MFERIPAEMRARRQWVCWRLDKDKGKVPYNPHTGQLASVTDPSTWASFDETLLVISAYSGPGYVLTPEDGLSCIDLDHTEDEGELKRQIAVYEAFNSYTERSQSGRGAHIWVKGKIPSGRRRAKIEIYSERRFMCMTGEVIRDVPIEMRQNELTQLWEQMGKSGKEKKRIEYQDEPEKENDGIIIDRCRGSRNGQKFALLHNGQWELSYKSQSEADLAYIDIVAFYTKNRNQINRIFLESGLGKRDKGRQRPSYIANMIDKALSEPLNSLAPISDELKNNLNAQLAALQLACAAPVSIAPENPYSVPPGLLGEIARFIYAASPRPVPEIALAGAIGLMAGICGRAYNVSGTGLNQYVLALAQTGVGKEGAAKGINKLLSALKSNVPASDGFMGPGYIASPQALIKHLNASLTKSFVSILGEFGLMLNQMASKRADSNLIGLRRLFLDLYNKSGKTDELKPTIYSDKTQNVPAVGSPAFTILAESTPEEFYSILDETLVSQGFVPRFSIIEYYGERPKRNENHDSIFPNADLLNNFSELCAYALMLNGNNKVVDIRFDPSAKKLCDEFDEFCDYKINKASKDVFRHVWNRGHLKALKHSGLLAVGINTHNPIVDVCSAKWAIEFVKADSYNLVRKFEDGEIGELASEPKQTKLVHRIMIEWITKEWKEISKYGVGTAKLHNEKVIPYKFLNKRLSCMAEFRKDRIGATNAIKRAIETLEKNGDIQKVSGAFYGFGGICYALVNLA